jgi:hypothetical protein
MLDRSLSASFPSIDPLRPCILAIRGGLRPHELPVPDPEDSSTMEKSVVTFSRQRRKESLVGDLVSSPESVGGGDTSLPTSFPSIDPLRPCILAIRGGLRPHELPLCSLKPPYFRLFMDALLGQR